MAANHQLIATKQAKQSKCPFSGEPCKPENKVTVNGASVAFCCENCLAKAEKASGEEQLKLLFSNAAFEKAEFKVAEEVAQSIIPNTKGVLEWDAFFCWYTPYLVPLPRTPYQLMFLEILQAVMESSWWFTTGSMP